MKNIIKIAQKLREKPNRVRKELTLDEKTEKAMQRQLDKLKNDRGVSMSWQTFFEASCVAFLEESKRKS